MSSRKWNSITDTLRIIVANSVQPSRIPADSREHSRRSTALQDLSAHTDTTAQQRTMAAVARHIVPNKKSASICQYKIRIYYASEYLTMEREVICSICLSQHCHEMHCKTCTATDDKVVCKTCIRKMFRICTCEQRDVYYTCPHCRTKIKEPGWVGECLESQKQIVRLLRSCKIP